MSKEPFDYTRSRAEPGLDASQRYRDRREAGRLLAERLAAMDIDRPSVVALPRGGVPVGHEVARRLGCPLDAFMVRKLGAPENPEYGIGAIAEGGTAWIDPGAIQGVGISEMELESIKAAELKELERRVQRFRNGRPLHDLRDKSVILVDDGLATGVTAIAAVRALRTLGPKHLILAVPVGQPETVARLREEADEVICLRQPKRLFSVGLWYDAFDQTSDDEVIRCLEATSLDADEDGPVRLRKVLDEEITIAVDEKRSLPGHLYVPPHPAGIVIFAHGSGSSRKSPRNIRVATTLNRAGLGTLLFDLLTPEESLERSLVFDIPLLAERLMLSERQLREFETLRHLPLGIFGASTGGGAALWAAARLGRRVSAVVSRGGRPDLALPMARQVTAPTLLIVGGEDEPVIALNRRALRELPHGRIIVIPGASHLFEEPGTLESVADLAIAWFKQHLRPGAVSQAA